MGLDEKQILRLLESGMQKGGKTHSIRDIVEALKAGQMQAFLNDGAIAITQVVDFPQKRVGDSITLSGAVHKIVAIEKDELVVSAPNSVRTTVAR